MAKKFVVYLLIIFIIMWGYVQNRYDYFSFGFITLALAAIDMELVNRMDSYFKMRVRSSAARYIIFLLLGISVVSFLDIHQSLDISLHGLSIAIYGLSIATYIASVIIFYRSYK